MPRFEAQLSYVSGYLRSGRLVGTLTQEEYNHYFFLSKQEQHEMLQELGTVEVTDLRIEDYGDIFEVRLYD